MKAWAGFRSSLGVLLLSATMTVLSGCDLLTTDPEAAGDTPECILPTGEPSGKEPRVAIVVDVSRSTRTSVKNSEVPSYLNTLSPVMNAAVSDGARVSIGSFSGPGASVQWTKRDQPTDSRMGNPKNQEKQDASTQACLKTLLETTLDTAATQAGTDVLGAIRAAADLLKGSDGGKKKMVVATDGLITTGCADLTHTRFAGTAEIKAIVNVCKERKELREGDLSGVEVSLVGIGRPGPDQPVASPQQLDWLRQLWEALCAAGGGSSCQVSTVDVGREPGKAGPDTVADPVVGFSAEWSFSIPGAALFDTAKWDLRDEAKPHLLGIAINIRTIPRSKVDVNGHADITGNAKNNQNLSVKRAEAVRDFLANNGVANIFVHGFGDTRPVCRDVPASEPCLQQNRRVEIIATQL